MPHVNDLHEQHDPILVVSLASGDLATADRDRATAQSLVDTCADCARLRDDVLALAAATKALPPAVRTRDFRLTPEQAARLQPGGWRRFFTAPGALFSRQLGVGLTTLGIAGILISSIGSLPLGMASSAGAPAAGSDPSAPAAAEALRTEDTQQAPEPAASEVNTDTSNQGQGTTTIAGSPAASTHPFRANGASPPAASQPAPDEVANPAAAPTDDEAGRNSGGLAEAPAASDAGDASSPLLFATDDDSSGPPILLVVSSLLLVAGVVVLLARRVASGARSA
jgi:hypothetical protein